MAVPTNPVAPESQIRRRPTAVGMASAVVASVGVASVAATSVVLTSVGAASAGAAMGFLFGGVEGFAFAGARRVGAFFTGVAWVAGVADAGSPSKIGACFGFAVAFAAPGGLAGGFGAGLSRRVVMARASRAGLEPAPDQ
jgi:hypothetical protein